MTDTLSRIERNGIKINRTTLADIRREYEDELFTLERRLEELAAYAMGDTPINLNPNPDVTISTIMGQISNKSLTWRRPW